MLSSKLVCPVLSMCCLASSALFSCSRARMPRKGVSASRSIVSRSIVSSALSGSHAWAPRIAAVAGIARGTTDQGAALAAL